MNNKRLTRREILAIVMLIFSVALIGSASAWRGCSERRASNEVFATDSLLRAIGERPLAVKRDSVVTDSVKKHKRKRGKKKLKTPAAPPRQRDYAGETVD